MTDETATTSFAVPSRSPCHLEATVRVLQRSLRNRIDLWDGARYLRVLATPEGTRLVAVENRGTVDAPAVQCQIFGGSVSPATQVQLSMTVQRLLGLTADLTPFYTLAARDTRLKEAINVLRGLKPPRFATLFETVVNVIPFQQLSIAAGVAVVARLVERFGPRVEFSNRTYVAFPRPDQIAAARLDELQSLGLSRAKARTLSALAGQVLSGALSEEQLEAMPSTEAMAALTAQPGIGPWSAGLILLRGLGRTEIFPAGDVGAARNLGRLLAMEGRTRVVDVRPVVAQLGPAQGYLYFYALGWRLWHEGLITPAPPAR